MSSGPASFLRGSTAARLCVALLVVVVLATVRFPFADRTPDDAPSTTRADTVAFSLPGFASWGDSAVLGPGSVLRVQLLDLESDAPGAVVASSTVTLDGTRRRVAWALRVPLAQRHLATEGLLVASISDGARLRYLGTQIARPVPPPPPASRGFTGPRVDPPMTESSPRYIRLADARAQAE